MTKTVRNSLFTLLTAILACSVILFSATFVNAKALNYEGLTGTKEKSEVISAVELDSFAIDEQSSIRLVAPYGVRFTTVIDAEDVEKLPNNAKFGTIILPESMLDGELTLSTPSIAVGYANNYGVADGGLSYYYKVALIGNESESLATEFYNMELCARSFVTYTYAGENGDVEEVIYTDTLTTLPKETANETLAQKEIFELTDDAVSLLKTVVKEEDKIGYFDTAYGASQFTSAYSGDVPMVSTEYSTEVKFGDENGSTKFTWNAAPYGNGECIYFTDLIQKDVTDYDYIMFRIYNPNDFDIIFKFQPWFAWTRCTANAWSYVKATAEEITSAKSLDDITGLTLLFDGGEQLIGKSVYLSAMYAVKEDGEKLCNFDESAVAGYGGDKIWGINSSISYSTDVAYKNEAGSTKLVASAGNDGRLYQFGCYVENDVTKYEYIIFRVYNANDYDIKFEFEWEPWVVCPAGEWTDIKLYIADLPNDGSDGSQTKINWATYKAVHITDGGKEGLTIHLSAAYGFIKEVVEDDDVVEGGDEVVELEGTKLFNFDESSINVSCSNSTTEYSTEVKYGQEAGSTKVVMKESSAQTLLFEGWGFAESDLTAYDYIIMRVYNANDYAIKFHINWCGTTVCAAGEWTEVKINTSSLYDASAINGKGFYAMDDATNQAVEGLTVYLSALYGCVEE